MRRFIQRYFLPNARHSYPEREDFDLRGLKVGDSFVGCKLCFWRSEGAVAMCHQCPDCGKGRELYVFTVGPEDAGRL